eukprot:gene5020-6249_t
MFLTRNLTRFVNTTSVVQNNCRFICYGKSFYSTTRYTKDHEWVKKDGDLFTMGITDFAQRNLGDVVFVELPSTGKTFKAGEPFGYVESVKAVSDIFTPLAGEVSQVNTDLSDEPEVINDSPMDEGWMIKLKSTDDATFNKLLSQSEYDEFVKQETNGGH